METSLIGKALDFGSMLWGFESLVSNMKYYSYAFVINHLNLIAFPRRRWTLIKYNKRSLQLILLFHKLGIINSYLIINANKKLIKISPFIYRRSPFFKNIRLVSTPSKVFTVKLSTLRVLNTSLGQAIMILETTKGLLTHYEALKLKTSGRILCVII